MPERAREPRVKLGNRGCPYSPVGHRMGGHRYADTFEMPLHDPALGLGAHDPFCELDYAHNASSHVSTLPRRTTPARSNRASS